MERKTKTYCSITRGGYPPPKKNQTGEIKIKNPLNYKTQEGLLKAIRRMEQKPPKLNGSFLWWLQNAKETLIYKWNWDETQASKYIAAFRPSYKIVY